MRMKKLLALAAFSTGLLAIGTGAASAATYVNDFSGIGQHDGTLGNPLFTGPYSQGGVSVQYFGSNPRIWTTSQSGVSGFTWAPANSSGYTAITLTGGGTFSSVSLVAGSNWIGGQPQLTYQLLDAGSVVATGSLGSLAVFGAGMLDYTLPKGVYTELDVQGPSSAVAFDQTFSDELVLGKITINTVGAPGAKAGEGLPSLILLTLAGLVAGRRRFSI